MATKTMISGDMRIEISGKQGCGKSTVAAWLAKSLRSSDVVVRVIDDNEIDETGSNLVLKEHLLERYGSAVGVVEKRRIGDRLRALGVEFERRRVPHQKHLATVPVVKPVVTIVVRQD